MKKIIAGLLLVVNLMTINANAAWDFEEKIIDDAYGVEFRNECIITYEFKEGDGTIENPTTRYDSEIFDLNGNKINYMDIKRTAQINQQNSYIPNNQQSFVVESNGEYEIADMGIDNWMAVSRKVDGKFHKEYALIDFDGNILVDYGDYKIEIFEGSQEWQSGEFAKIQITNSADEKYINRQLEEIDLFSLDSVYCKEYYEFSDTVIIFNHYIDKDYKYQMKYALYDKRNKKYIMPYDNVRLNKVENYIARGTEVLNQYGKRLFNIEGINCLKTGFEDGIAKIGGYDYFAFCDTNGKNIFGREYDYAERIDNNEFLIREGREIKILTAKGIIGEALNTDVKIDINDYKIPCYSAYGYAVIKAEDLRYFGFDVEWNGEERMLYISRNLEYYDITAGDFGEIGETGTHYADIYGSDINVEYNGKRLSSYCINGVTLIKPEDLVAEGITFNYDDSQRTLFMNVEGLERR